MNIDQPSSNFIQLPWMKRPSHREREEFRKEKKRLPLVDFLPKEARGHIIAVIGEFYGTFLFLFFAFAGTQVAVPDEPGARPGTIDLLYISLVFGFSLAVNVWAFVRISGGLFNPAVTLALALIGGVTWLRAGLVIIAEILAGIAAAGVVDALFPGPMTVSTNLAPETSSTRGLFIEMFLTSELVFAICMLAAEKHKGNFLAPIGIGLALFVAELAGVRFTGGSLNPARSFGPCVVTHTFPHYHWIYWVGPALGSLLAVGFYRFYKILESETTDLDKEPQKHGEHTSIDGDAEIAKSELQQGRQAAESSPPGSPVVDNGSRDMAYRDSSLAEKGAITDESR